MSDADLRPRPGAPPTRPEPLSGGSRWWSPLMSTYGFLALIVFIGLAIGVYEDTIGRLFSQAPAPGVSTPAKSDLAAMRRAIEAETAKLDAAATGELLRTALSNLPGDDLTTNYDRADYLAAVYSRKWHKEDDEQKAQTSIEQYEEIRKKRNIAYQRFSRDADERSGSPKPKVRDILSAINRDIGKIRGIAIQTSAQLLARRIRDEARLVAKMPVLASEIESMLREWPTATGERRREIKTGLSARVIAYAAADELRRDFPSTRPDPLRMSRQERARDRLRSITKERYDEGVSVVLESLPVATENDMQDAFTRVLR
jgi:hypothetical protein